MIVVVYGLGPKKMCTQCVILTPRYAVAKLVHYWYQVHKSMSYNTGTSYMIVYETRSSILYL